MVEFLVRWTDVQVNGNDTEAYLRKIIDGEESGPKISYSYSPMTMNLLDIKRFNQANDKEHTAIRFTDGNVNIIKIPYNAFQQFYIERTGRIVESILPEGYVDGSEEPNVEDEDEDII